MMTVATIPPLEVASDSWVCVPRKLGMCKGEVTFVFSISVRVTHTVFYSL